MISRYTLPEIGAVWTEKNKFDIWLKIEILATEAWAKLGKVPDEAVAAIKEKAGFDIARIEAIEAEVHHDVIAFLTNVTEHIGTDGKFLHYGMTSSDMLDTALSIQMVQSVDLLLDELKQLIGVLRDRALENKDTLMVGRTHGVHAEPITFGLKLSVWFFEFVRNLERLTAAKNGVSVGKLSGAVGSYATIDPFVETYVCENLGLTPASAATQVIQRDRHAEFLTTLAIIGSSCEKIATEIRGLQRTEVNEAEEAFGSKQKGSSAMPHKKNPIISERICGLARLLRGNALVSIENNALWHERDISHSSAERVIIPDSIIALFYMLRKTNDLLKGLNINKEQMLKTLMDTGFVFSQKVLLALVDKGLDRDQAYRVVQGHSMAVRRGEGRFLDLLKSDSRISELMPEKELESLFNADEALIGSNLIVDRVIKKYEELKSVG